MNRWGWINKKELISVWVLAMLLEGEMHGYEMLSRVNESPLVGPLNPGGLYRVLRELEMEGLVESSWDTRGGPARRMYRITERGKRWLLSWKRYLVEQKNFLENIINKLEEV